MENTFVESFNGRVRDECPPYNVYRVTRARAHSLNLLAFDTLPSEIKWQCFCWTSFVETSARIRYGILHVGLSDYQQLLAIDVASGKQVWTSDTAGSDWVTLAAPDRLAGIGVVGDAMTIFEATANSPP